MDWLDDTQYWDLNSDLELRLSLIREGTNTFLHGALHLLIRMDIFGEYCFAFELGAREGLSRARTCWGSDAAILSLQFSVAKSLCFTKPTESNMLNPLFTTPSTSSDF